MDRRTVVENLKNVCGHEIAAAMSYQGTGRDCGYNKYTFISKENNNYKFIYEYSGDAGCKQFKQNLNLTTNEVIANIKLHPWY